MILESVLKLNDIIKAFNIDEKSIHATDVDSYMTYSTDEPTKLVVTFEYAVLPESNKKV